MVAMRRILLNPGILLFAILYVISFGWLSRNQAFGMVEALFELALFGVVFPLMAWFATGRAKPLEVAAARSGYEVVLVLALLIALGVYLIGGPQAIDALLPRGWVDSPQAHFVVTLLKKLVVFVLLPYAVFRILFGYKWRDFGLQMAGLRELAGSHLFVVLLLCAAILAFQFFLGGAAAPLREGKLHPQQLLIGLPLCFVWLAVEAGLVEEFFFRAIVQSRLAAWLKSEISGVALMALVFGLAHAPGFIFRRAAEVEGLGANPSALDAIAYSIVILAPGAIVFGIVWARTKNLFALMIIHAAGDLLPNVAGFVQLFKI
jgi:membrane protease YdiL (CAAX protease family)